MASHVQKFIIECESKVKPKKQVEKKVKDKSICLDLEQW